MLIPSGVRLSALILICFVTVARSQDSRRIIVKHLQIPTHYPYLARQASVQGTVTAKLTIGTDGSVHELTLLSDSPVLLNLVQPETERVLRQWTFQCFDCASATFEHTIKFIYRLEGEEIRSDDSKVTLDLPDIVTISASPLLCDHCSPKAKR